MPGVEVIRILPTWWVERRRQGDPGAAGLNGRVVFGSFAHSPTIDGFFVVSLRTDPVAGTEAAATDLSVGSVILEVDTKPPWVIASELARRAE